MLPFWMSTEANVTALFGFLGFQTRRCSIVGRQIDLIATLKGTFSFQDENWVIEVTTEKVGSDKGSADYQKLALANKELFGGTGRMMLVTTRGFTDDQKTSLEKLSVVALTLTELESKTAGLARYAQNALRRIERRFRIPRQWAARRSTSRALVSGAGSESARSLPAAA